MVTMFITSITNDHGWVSFVVIIIQPFPHSRLITGFVTRVTRWVPHADQELLTLLEHPIFCVKFVLLDVFCLVFCTSLFVRLSFFYWLLLYCLPFFDLRLLITSLWFTASDYLPLIYGFWLPILYLQIFLQR